MAYGLLPIRRRRCGGANGNRRVSAQRSLSESESQSAKEERARIQPRSNGFSKDPTNGTGNMMLMMVRQDGNNKRGRGGDHIGTWPFHACPELKRFFSLILAPEAKERVETMFLAGGFCAKIFPYNSCLACCLRFEGEQMSMIWACSQIFIGENVNERGGKFEIVQVDRLSASE